MGGIALGVSARLVLFVVATGVLAFGGLVASSLLASLPTLDPVYTRAMLDTVSGVRLRGLDVAGPLGSALHAGWPAVFTTSSRVGLALVRVGVAPGSPVLGQMLATWMAQTGVLALGIGVIRWGLVKRRPWLIALGVVVQVQVALSILSSPPRVEQIDLTGASFAFNALLPQVDGRSGSLTDMAASLPSTVVVVSLVVLAFLWAYVGALGLLGLVWCGRWAWRAARYRRFQPVLPLKTVRVSGTVALGLLLSSGVVAGAVPLDSGASAPTAGPGLAAQAPSVTPSVAPTDVPETPTAVPAATAVVVEPPSNVQVVGGGTQFTYLVNGTPTVIRGMGLNTQYHLLMSPDEREARLDADMAEMSAMGVNTLLGWDPGEFDDTFMRLAQKHGLGVVVPFDLDPDLDYTDPAVRVALTQQVLAWVDTYKNYPSLRMWGLGNEVLHKIVHPAWVGQQDPMQAKKAQAFATWLVQVSDAIHRRDPNHPVTYREAEDAYNSWVLAAEKSEGDGPRPWFVWGTNVYTMRLQTIVDGWPRTGSNEPLWVSEFAPGGVAPADEPSGFQQMWQYIRDDQSWVLGGAVYAWTRNGPEEIDRTMGITNDGIPVDGFLYQALSDMFSASS